MNKEEIIEDIIKFIEDKERSIQNDTMKKGSQARSDAVKSILDELEKLTENEN